MLKRPVYREHPAPSMAMLAVSCREQVTHWLPAIETRWMGSVFGEDWELYSAGLTVALPCDQTL